LAFHLDNKACSLARQAVRSDKNLSRRVGLSRLRHRRRPLRHSRDRGLLAEHSGGRRQQAQPLPALDLREAPLRPGGRLASECELAVLSRAHRSAEEKSLLKEGPRLTWPSRRRAAGARLYRPTFRALRRGRDFWKMHDWPDPRSDRLPAPPAPRGRDSGKKRVFRRGRSSRPCGRFRDASPGSSRRPRV
jgi:hypothetical protein